MTPLARRFQAALRHPAYQGQRISTENGITMVTVIHRDAGCESGRPIVTAPAFDPEIAAVCRADYARVRRRRH